MSLAPLAALLALLCLSHCATGARIHKSRQEVSVHSEEPEDVTTCRGLITKGEIATCLCGTANNKGLSEANLFDACAELKAETKKMATSWRCAVRVTKAGSHCVRMDKENGELDEDDEEEASAVKSEPVPVEAFKAEAKKCTGTKSEKATCVCSLANAKGLSKLDVESRCRKLMMPMMYYAMPWQCSPHSNKGVTRCLPFTRFRIRPESKPVDIIEDGGSSPTVEEKVEMVTDCEGSWQAWGECSKPCGGGEQSRTYAVTTAAEGGTECPASPETQSCNTHACPVACVGSWPAWGGCSAQCGGGTRSRSYSVTTAASGGGIACPTPHGTDASEPCNSHACPVACVGSWSGWGGCSAQCGGGTRYRSWSRTTAASGGGAVCPHTHGYQDSEPCNTHGCPPVNCLMRFTSQSGCSVACGGGHVATHFQIITQPQNGGNPCHATTRYHACNTHGCPRKNCFPADALVETPAGPTRMSELRVGDAVRSVDGAGLTFFDKVYFFGHADGSSSTQYVDLKLADEQTSLQVSGRHFLPTCPEKNIPCEWAQRIHVYAKDVLAGDYMWTAPSAEASSSGGQIALRMVLESSTVVREGLYNPYTLSGKVVVNGAVASAHSEWILDDWSPESWTQYLPAVYQVVFLPGRWLYHLVGPAAADMLDVNNPQIATQKHGHGPEFLAACAMVFLSVMLVFPYKRRL